MATVMLIRVNVCLEFCLQCREKERKEERDREKRVREEDEGERLREEDEEERGGEEGAGDM